MQFSSRNRVDGVYNDMGVDGLRVGMCRYHALTTFKHFFHASLGVLLHHKRVGIVGSVRGELEMVILSFPEVRTFPKSFHRFFELFGIVLINEQVLHGDKFRLIFSGNVSDCLMRRSFPCHTFE